jgi:hypothetical protein
VQTGAEARGGAGRAATGGVAVTDRRLPVAERLHGYLDRLLGEAP